MGGVQALGLIGSVWGDWVLYLAFPLRALAFQARLAGARGFLGPGRLRRGGQHRELYAPRIRARTRRA
eukprot:12393626-Heterocapsa_arctica.AAC.1